MALDGVDAGATPPVAETGVVVPGASTPDRGRRATLAPDHHVCVAPAEEVVGRVPEALDPRHPLRPVVGPSATSDIELDRVEGVHGPRRLDVVLVGGVPQA